MVEQRTVRGKQSFRHSTQSDNPTLKKEIPRAMPIPEEVDLSSLRWETLRCWMTRNAVAAWLSEDAGFRCVVPAHVKDVIRTFP